MRKIIFLLHVAFLLLFSSGTFAQTMDSGRARGLFMSFAVGPRIPVASMGNSQAVGVGINFGLSYTDNEYLPLFVYAKVGFEHFPGSVAYYRRSDYSSLTTNVVPLNLGARIFFPPVVKDIVLLIPTAEFGGSIAFFEKSHQFKIDSGRSDFLESTTRAGFHVGAGLSMFLLEVMGSYNYYPGNEYLSAEIRMRIPIFIKL
ncbi:MAG TPA: outer membrane beta-barrel protein [Ignavibacteriales bacterium]|nr:outer membrane beta-barrel protein [Ignavibacteriales bacterium]